MKFIIVGLLAKGSCRGHPAVTGTKSDCEAPLHRRRSRCTPPPSWPWTPTCWTIAMQPTQQLQLSSELVCSGNDVCCTSNSWLYMAVQNLVKKTAAFPSRAVLCRLLGDSWRVCYGMSNSLPQGKPRSDRRVCLLLQTTLWLHLLLCCVDITYVRTCVMY